MPHLRLHAGAEFVAGDYVTFAILGRASIDDVKVEMRVNRAFSYAAGDIIETPPLDRTLSDGWHLFSQTVKIVNSPVDSEDLNFRFEFSGSGTTAFDLHLARPQVFIPTSPLILRDYINGTIADDSMIASLLGVGDEWTATMVWRPETGFYNLDAAEVMPICHLEATDGSYIDVFYNQTESRWEATNGTDTIFSADTIEPYFNDCIHVGVVGDTAGTKVYIYDPVNGLISFGNGTTAEVDTQLSFIRTCSSNTAVGEGSTANIRGFDSKLIAGDVSDVFDSVNDLEPAESTCGYRSRYEGR
jgi:hypothetical protein